MMPKYLIRISGRTSQEGKYWIAFCNELPVASAGLTVQEAMDNCFNAIKAYVEALGRMGTLEETLSGFKVPLESLCTPEVSVLGAGTFDGRVAVGI